MQRDNRKTTIAKIHIAKSQLDMDDDTYRQLLQNAVGKRSCSDMQIGELYQVLKVLEGKGFRKKNRKYSPKTRDKLPYQKTETDKIRALWIDMHKHGIVRNGSETGLNRYIERLTGIARIEWLSAEQQYKIIESLKQWQKRAQV